MSITGSALMSVKGIDSNAAKADAAQMRKDIVFESKGVSCRVWLYMPDNIDANQKAPTIVMAHGFSAVKKQALPVFERNLRRRFQDH